MMKHIMEELVFMKNRLLTGSMIILISAVFMLAPKTGYAENIDPENTNSQYAYGENVGWFNAEPLGNGGPGIEVQDKKLTGYLWAENIGWINVSPSGYGGIIKNGQGSLSGYAWGANVGWINFAPTHGGVSIDPNTGVFSGYAWGENIGWIRFSSTGTIPFAIRTSWEEDFPWILFYPAILKKK
jgi:hypothetical protein